MRHQDLANRLCELTNQWINAHSQQRAPIFSQDHDFFARQFFSRLYYALFHKCLEQNQELANSEASNKHEIIEKKLQQSNNDKVYQLFKSLKFLRVWADYQLGDPPESIKPDRMKYRQYQVYKILQQNFSF